MSYSGSNNQKLTIRQKFTFWIFWKSWRYTHSKVNWSDIQKWNKSGQHCGRYRAANIPSTDGQMDGRTRWDHPEIKKNETNRIDQMLSLGVEEIMYTHIDTDPHWKVPLSYGTSTSNLNYIHVLSISMVTVGNCNSLQQPRKLNLLWIKIVSYRSLYLPNVVELTPSTPTYNVLYINKHVRGIWINTFRRHIFG